MNKFIKIITSMTAACILIVLFSILAIYPTDDVMLNLQKHETIYNFICTIVYLGYNVYIAHKINITSKEDEEVYEHYITQSNITLTGMSVISVLYFFILDNDSLLNIGVFILLTFLSSMILLNRKCFKD